jgi:nucleoside-diphosphate-sugar epimerase
MKDLADNIAATMNITKKFSSVPEGLLKMGLKAVQAFLPGKINVTPEQIEKLATETTLSTDSLIASTGFAPATNLQSAIKAEVDWATANKLI